MKPPFRPSDETERLEALRQLDLLDTSPEQALDDLTALAAHICQVPTAVISLVDEKRQWFKSRLGLSASETPRDISFCGHAILQPDLFIVPDATKDERFADNPLVTGDPYVRFYAGAPLLTPAGRALGALCVIDRVPRQLDPSQQEALRILSRQVISQLELRRKTRESAETEERLRLALDAAHMGTFDWDVLRNRIAWSRWHEELWGYQPGEFGGTYEAFSERVHPEDLPGVNSEVARCIAAREPFAAEYRVVWPDGSVRWVLGRGEFAFSESGEPVRMRGIVLDNTAHQQAKRKLAESERRFRQLAENITEIFWMTESASNQTLYVSPAYAQIWGRSCESLYASPDSWLDSIHLEDRERVQAAAMSRQATGSYDEEYRIIRPDGCVRWIRDRAFPVRDAAGGIERIVGVARDITDRKEAEAEARRREERFRSLIENASDLITVINRDGLIRFQSPSAERILGYNAEEMTGKDAFDLIHPEDRSRMKASIQRALTHPSAPVCVEVRCRRQNGTWAVLQSIGRSIPHQAAEGFIVVNSRDITESRQLEEQLRQSQKMEAIGQLAGGVAHDFNNILAAIMLQAELATTATNPPPATRVLLDDIKATTERAAKLTRQLLAFSRRQVMQLRQLDLNEIVTSLAKMLQRILGADVSLQLTLYPRPLITRADAGMLDQVLMNLAVNARDAMPRGGRLLIETIETVLTAESALLIPDASPGRHVCLRVADTGSGIAPEHLAHIFEPFFTTKEPGKGTGLGLATVFGIVKQHGGSLTVASEVGQGTMFQIFLRADESSSQSAGEEFTKPKPRGGTETILVAEDDPSVRQLTRAVLERVGYRVLEAPDGVEALRIGEQHQDSIRLLLTDLVMPGGVNGLELATRLQVPNPKLRVIFTSGYSADIAGRELALQEGQNFIQKPSAPDHLLETVRRCLDN